MFFNELPAAFDVFAHRNAKHSLGLGGFLHGHAEQHADVRIQRGLPEQRKTCPPIRAIRGQSPDVRNVSSSESRSIVDVCFTKRLLGYLNITDLQVSLLLNFKEATLHWKRVVNQRMNETADYADERG